MRTAVRAPHRMTVAEFQDWRPPADLVQRRWELVDGEPICMAPPSLDHGAIQSELARLLGNWLAAHRPDCRLIVTPGIVPRLRADINERVPDLAVSCGPFRSGRTMDDPILLIEILSASNEAQTRANVWAYTTIPSVAEIVLIASTSIYAETYRRNPDGSWPSHPQYPASDEQLDLQSIGLQIELRAVYRTTGFGRS